MTQQGSPDTKWYGTNRKARLGMILGSLGLLACVFTIRHFWDARSARAEPSRSTSAQPTRSTLAVPQGQEAWPDGPQGPQAGRTVLSVMAIVNDEKIGREELARECLRHYGTDVLECMVNKFLIVQECRRQGITVTRKEAEDEVKRMADLFGVSVSRWYEMYREERGIDPEQYLSDIIWPALALEKLAGERLKITEEEILAAYETQYGPAVSARLISCRDRKKAEQLRAAAVAKPEEFGTLAMENSEDTVSASAKGWIPPIRMHASSGELEKAAFALKDGEISPVVQVGDEYVILKRESLIPAREEPMAEARPKLERLIKEQKLKKASHELFAELQKRAKVENYFNDPTKRDTGIAAVLNGQRITVRRLAEECIARHGIDVLNGMIQRRLIEQACRQRKITLTDADIEEEIRRAAELSVPPKADGSPDVEAWIKLATEQQGITKEVYIRDSVWPSAALKKLVVDEIEVTEEDMKKGFEADFGPRVRCLAIVLDDLRRAQRVWAMARENPTPEHFGKLAEEYSIEPSSRQLRGQVPPIQRHRGQPALEEEAFSLAPGKLSGIIQVADKYVILLCEGRTEPIEVKPEEQEEVRRLIHDNIHEKKLRAAMGRCFEELQDHARIDNFLAGTSHAPTPPSRAELSARPLHQVPPRR